jgi:hypothetical protein
MGDRFHCDQDRLTATHKSLSSSSQLNPLSVGIGPASVCVIFRMVAKNPTWRPPRIHGELLILGFDISERTISDGRGACLEILSRPQPSGGHRRHGLLHGSDRHVRRYHATRGIPVCYLYLL